MCTGIKIDYDGGCVLGRTMDYEVPITYNGLYFPKGYNYCKDLNGNLLYSKYRILGMCFKNLDPIKDGINEHGLIGITNEFSAFNLYSKEVDPDLLNISSLDFMTYALARYKSVEELVGDLDNIQISTFDKDGDKVLSPQFHFCFTDSTKKCVVIEPKKGKLVAYENLYNVMTNSPAFPYHVRKLKATMDLNNLEDFNSAKNLPGGYDPSSRFIRAYFFTKRNVKSNNSKEALANAHYILGAMALPNGFIRNKKYGHNTYTRYIVAYETRERLMTVKAENNPMVYHLSLDDLKDCEERREFFIEETFQSERLK